MSQDAARHLMNALKANQGTSPVRDLLPENDYDAAYETQRAFNQMRLDEGQVMIGRKAGFTNPAVQAAMGVFDVMDTPNRAEIPASKVIAPKIEAEIAFVMGSDLEHEAISMADIMRSIDYLMPAIEIADTRMADWNNTAIDTIADNVAASHFVLGHKVQMLDQFDVSQAKADIHVNGKSVADGAAVNVLGSPLNSLQWLANQMVAQGTPICEGDVILSGSLGPMVPVMPGDLIEIYVENAGMASVAIGASS